MFGKCMNHRCEKLHFKLCKEFMNLEKCHYGEKCRFYHPTQLRLKSTSQVQNSINDQVYNCDPLTYAQCVKKNFEPQLNSFDQSPFLGQSPKPHQSVPMQESHIQQRVQNPFLEFVKSQKEILRRLEHLEIQNQNSYNKW